MAEDLQYPVGKFIRNAEPLKEPQRQTLRERIAVAPVHLRATVAKLTEAQLNTPDCRNSWTARQIGHPVAHISLCQP